MAGGLQSKAGGKPEARGPRLPDAWDHDIDAPTFRLLLTGALRRGRLDRRWAAVRLLDYAPYAEIVRLLGFAKLVAGWPEWRRHVRSPRRRRAFDFLVEWLPRHDPELLAPR